LSEFDDPKRWRPPKGTVAEPTGTFRGGICNPEFLLLFGSIISSWVHLEEEMIDVVNLLVFVDHDIRRAAATKTRGHMPGRQIFRSISANGVRTKMMRNLLGQFLGNYTKNSLYDDVISEFQCLVNLRNDWLHGLWWTLEDGRVFLQVENVNEFSFSSKKEVKKEALEDFIKRSNKITKLIREINIKEYNTSETKKAADARNNASSPEKTL
jgi:hypothetical protein